MFNKVYGVYFPYSTVLRENTVSCVHSIQLIKSLNKQIESCKESL